MKVERSIHIARPLDRVFAFVSDFENSPKWQLVARDTRRITDGPIGPGTRYRQAVEAMGMKGVVTIELTDFQPGRAVGFTVSRFGPIAPRAAFHFEEQNGGTRVTFRGDPNPQGPFRLLSPVIVAYARRLWAKHLAALRRTLESAS
ncbi:MAG: SRPBCC family protein [Actinobacteria bacterium]|nr:SRPBCC family protein [Actinomycetota bacterium]